MFGIAGWMILGLFVGAIAKLLTPTRDPGGFIITMLLGMAGAGFGGIVGRSFLLYTAGQPVSLFMALFGSVALLLVYRVFLGPTNRTAPVAK